MPFLLSRSWTMLTFFIIAFGSFEAAAVENAVKLQAKVAGNQDHTRFVAFLSKPVDYRIFAIADPYRIVVDLPEVGVQVPGDKGAGLVLSSRAGQFSAGRSRIVIDLAEPALVQRSEIIPGGDNAPARLVLELEKVTSRAFLAAVKTPEPPAAAMAKQPAPPQDPQDKRPLIVIDPGHGGVDIGARGHQTNTPEKDVALDFCLELRKNLEKTGRYRIIMTRDSDVFIPLEDRAKVASDNNADLFVAVHADALDPRFAGKTGLQEVRGGTVYTLSEQASDELAKSVAANENKTDLQAGLTAVSDTPGSADLDEILSDLVNQRKKRSSLAFARSFIEKLKSNYLFHSPAQRSANLRVLKAPGIPSALIELGYLTNDEDEKLLISKEWREKSAALFAGAIDAFLASHFSNTRL